jgi:hypothetical protein
VLNSHAQVQTEEGMEQKEEVYANVISENLTLSGDLVVEGNLLIRGGNVNLNGYKLVVEGDLRHVNGRLKINEGTLEVKGNYYIETIEGGASDGALVMSETFDTVKVLGDFVMNSSRGSRYNVFSAGVMEVKGDFTQKGIIADSSSENFVATSNHKLKLSGDEVQKIIFESLRFKINILEITKPLDTGYLIEPNKVVWEEVLLVEKGSEEPVEIKSFPEDIIYEDYTLDENLEFEGDLIITANIDLNGHTLVVKGDLWHLGGRISVNNGNLIVYGSYYIESFAGGQVDAKLAMINEEDYVQVFGDFVMHSISDNGSVLRAGTLEVKGDFYQRNELNNSNAVRNFEANGTHRVRLSGDKVQTVVFINYPNSMFNILEITKPLETGYLFRNEGEVWKVLETNETSILYGDLNNDGVINSIDSSLMTRYILGVIDKFPYEDGLTAADLNGDKVINSIDSSLMTRYILGIIDKFPVE